MNKMIIEKIPKGKFWKGFLFGLVPGFLLCALILYFSPKVLDLVPLEKQFQKGNVTIKATIHEDVPELKEISENIIHGLTFQLAGALAACKEGGTIEYLQIINDALVDAAKESIMKLTKKLRNPQGPPRRKILS